MTLKVLGPGCMNCRTLERRAQEALQALGITAGLEKVEKLEAIAAYGVLRTPGLVIDERVVWQGSVPTVERIKEILLAAQARGLAQ